MFALHFLSQPGAFLLLLVKTHGSTQGRTIPPYAPRPCGWPCEGWKAVINVRSATLHPESSLHYAILILVCDILTLTRLKSELHFAFLI